MTPIFVGVIGGALAGTALLIYDYWRTGVQRRERLARGDTTPLPKRSLGSRVIPIVVGLVAIGIGAFWQYADR